MATEPRLHGVFGARAQAMLDRPLLTQVAGDDQAGFYPPRVAYGDTTGAPGWMFSPHRAGEPPKAEGPPGEVNWRLRDPRGLMVEPHDTVPPPINGHWNYQRLRHGVRWNRGPAVLREWNMSMMRICSERGAGT